MKGLMLILKYLRNLFILGFLGYLAVFYIVPNYFVVPEENAILESDNELMKSVIDKFGENIRTERINEDQFKATVTVAASKTFYAWCFRFAGQMKIAGPRKVKKQYLEMAKKITE